MQFEIKKSAFGDMKKALAHESEAIKLDALRIWSAATREYEKHASIPRSDRVGPCGSWIYLCLDQNHLVGIMWKCKRGAAVLHIGVKKYIMQLEENTDGCPISGEL